jgi:hypothetical protein
MDVIEAVVGRRHREDAPALLEPLEAVPLLEISHEVFDAGAGRRNVPSNRNVLFGRRAPSSWLHDQFAVLPPNAKQFLRRIFVEVPVEAKNEIA